MNRPSFTAGDRVSRLLQDHGVSVRSLERRLNARSDRLFDREYHHVTIGNWLKGGDMRAEFVADLCRELDLHPVWVLYGEGPRHWHLPDQRSQTLEVVAEWLESAAHQLRGEVTLPPSEDESE